VLASPEQARRIDRLAWRAHLFHRWAHHPLCDAYAAETIRIGRRTRLCRGCAAAAGGGVLGAAGALASFPLSRALLVMLVASGALTGLTALLAVRRSKTPPRPSKVLTRALPATFLLACAVSGPRSGTVAGWAVAALSAALLLGAVSAYRLRGPDRAPCDRCPERSSTEVCSGLRPIARREAAFARAAARILHERRGG
jgi:hypothetical protein